jgi:ABC-type multidrug transport system ATPase subunit
MLLDEPTAGLDPAQRNRFRDLIAGLDHNVAVLVSTHQVDDLTELFDTVVVLDAGQVRFQGSTASFMALAPAGSSRPAEEAYLTLVRTEA